MYLYTFKLKLNQNLNQTELLDLLNQKIIKLNLNGSISTLNLKDKIFILIKNKHFEHIYNLPLSFLLKFKYKDLDFISFFLLYLNNINYKDFEIIIKIYKKYENYKSLFNLINKIDKKIYFNLLKVLLKNTKKNNIKVDEYDLNINDYCYFYNKKQIIRNQPLNNNLSKYLQKFENNIKKEIIFSKKIEQINLNKLNKLKI